MWVRSVRFYHSRLSFCVRVAFDTKMNGKLAKYFVFYQISGNLHQFFPRAILAQGRSAVRSLHACDRFLSFPLTTWWRMGVKTGRIVLQPQGEVFSSIQVTAWSVVTAELLLARDHSTSPAYQAGCVLWRGMVQLADASSQTWLRLWESEKAQVLGRDGLCLTCTSAILPWNSKEEKKQSCDAFQGEADAEMLYALASIRWGALFGNTLQQPPWYGYRGVRFVGEKLSLLEVFSFSGRLSIANQRGQMLMEDWYGRRLFSGYFYCFVHGQWTSTLFSLVFSDTEVI